VRLLANPLLVKMVVVMAASVFAMIVGVLFIRGLRQDIAQEAARVPVRADESIFPFEAYQAVIQRLKQQELELNALRRADSERAKASENISAALLSNLSSGVLLFNTRQLVQQANPAARLILGYASPAGLHARDVFRGVSSLLHESADPATSPASLLEVVESALEDGVTYRRMQANYIAPSGEQKVLGITVSPVRSGQETLGAACLISDLTETKRLEQQVRVREKLASLGEMSAGIAHEFKNSLATISGYAQMLAAENAGRTTNDFAGRIVTETASLSRIVTGFLEFARPQALRQEPVDLRSTLEDCAHESPVDLHLESVPAGFTLQGDPTALRQAFANLLRNSAEASARGQARVDVAARCDGRVARVVVADNGPGIPPEDLNRIFVPFFTTKAQGTGLGLALVHRIVTEHGGSVAVESTGAGTTFTLSFPAAQLARAADAG